MPLDWAMDRIKPLFEEAIRLTREDCEKHQHTIPKCKICTYIRDEALKEGQKAERERILEAVKLTLQLYPHKQRDELYAEIIGYLNRKKEVGK